MRAGSGGARTDRPPTGRRRPAGGLREGRRLQLPRGLRGGLRELPRGELCHCLHGPRKGQADGGPHRAGDRDDDGRRHGPRGPGALQDRPRHAEHVAQNAADRPRRELLSVLRRRQPRRAPDDGNVDAARSLDAARGGLRRQGRHQGRLLDQGNKRRLSGPPLGLDEARRARRRRGLAPLAARRLARGRPRPHLDCLEPRLRHRPGRRRQKTARLHPDLPPRRSRRRLEDPRPHPHQAQGHDGPTARRLEGLLDDEVPRRVAKVQGPRPGPPFQLTAPREVHRRHVHPRNPPSQGQPRPQGTTPRPPRRPLLLHAQRRKECRR
mmetsp:Transcript_1313/g.4464  ORF Transcript_1313/g.4464 Transcript_1313/m.4464 type:complete len:323 (+) Transcript_1313:2644-3612(+)